MTPGSGHSDAAPRLLDPTHRAITIGIVAFITLVAFEGTAVITALPVVARDLGSVSALAWIVNAFVASSLLGQVLAGEWGDRYGPRRPILAGIAAFGLGGLIAGLAQNFPELLFGRALQGFGAGCLVVAAYVVIGRAYDPSLRAKAFGIISAAWVLPSIIGPVIAGWLADSVSWRWVFLVVVVLIWPPIFIVLPQLRRFDGPRDDAAPRTGRGRWALPAAAGLVLVQDGAQRASLVGGAEALAGVLLLIPALRRLLPGGTLRLRRGLPTVIAMRGLLAGAFFAAEAWIPLALQSVRGVSTTWSGLFLATGAIGWAVGAQAQGRPPRGWTPARFVVVGSVLVAVSLLLTPLALLPSLPAWILGIAWSIGAAGMGMAVSSLANLLLGYSAPGEQGANSASLQVSDSTGVVLITGLTGALFATLVVSYGETGPVFAALFVVTALVGLAAVVVSPRVRGRGKATAAGGHM